MKKTDLLIGFCIGIIVALLGATALVLLFTKFRSFSDIQFIKAEGVLGKVITLGAVLNVILFFILLKKNKELMARGIVLATITLAILTLFI
jgi:hypothetical protein